MPGTRCRRAAAAALALALVAVAGCGERREPPRLSLLLVTVDTLRADALGAYGGSPSATPRLDALAASGVVFERAWSQAPATGPAVASLLTSLYPHQHGVTHSTRPLAGRQTTLAERLAEGGWDTAGFVSSSILAARYGFRQGFGHWDERLSRPYAGSQLERDAADTTDAALAWLAGRERPFFLWLHYFDPHAPYRERTGGGSGAAGSYSFLRQLEQSGSRRLIERQLPEIRRLYRGEVAWVDGQIGRLLDALEASGRLDSTLVAVTADHGEELFDHGPFHGHVESLSESVLRVPLILWLPSRLPAGRRVDGLVELVDVAPTLLSILGVARPDGLSGRDLGRPATGTGESAPRLAFAQREPYDWMPGGLAFAVRDRRWKAVLYGEREDVLYDLELDPAERESVATAHPERLAELRRPLGERLAGALDGRPVGREALDEEDRATLRSLGYLD